MAKLKITRKDGSVGEFEISPLVQYGFEITHKKSFIKSFIEDQKASDLYWVAWECIRRSGETVPVFGESFIETLTSVEVTSDDLPLD
ncbi:hypothetical protein UFOVP479_6 [uncultured Caudovirales phage]|jgi:hypothetical protein|uniref:Uncharacterized protein n=1 Tax=uncultured Caudovirales phage TaxID=2100421 RepID=A0A6J5SNI3_9CAUD|nr:hypothetical protein UFOVP479_6 [uncultured Caudovirales phage]CAB4176004.1 hypothetical protein UFOVP977_2 [uncultured Caudovirales phage]CAB4180360.1 hypothetical protein UFOVP1039_21 [uncultured Caudovirales phage]CAB4185966.1 hypothetical protein UFOVP1141_20 [uncultured Caudovirales phage]CAB4189629.1 hypothetical protein UFOVP1203_11 [uncultured Caudovirales phage]